MSENGGRWRGLKGRHLRGRAQSCGRCRGVSVVRLYGDRALSHFPGNGLDLRRREAVWA
jgi:hypothetical protein